MRYFETPTLPLRHPIPVRVRPSLAEDMHSAASWRSTLSQHSFDDRGWDDEWDMDEL